MTVTMSMFRRRPLRVLLSARHSSFQKGASVVIHEGVSRAPSFDVAWTKALSIAKEQSEATSSVLVHGHRQALPDMMIVLSAGFEGDQPLPEMTVPKSIGEFIEECPHAIILGVSVDGRLASPRDTIDDEEGGSQGVVCQLVWIEDSDSKPLQPEFISYSSFEIGVKTPSLPSFGDHSELTKLIALPAASMGFMHFGAPLFSLGGLVERISSMFPDSSQFGATVQAKRCWVYPSAASAALTATEPINKAGAQPPSLSIEVHEDACIGISYIIDPVKYSDEQLRKNALVSINSALARAVLRWTCHRGFAMTTDVQKGLFVPHRYKLGLQSDSLPNPLPHNDRFLDPYEPKTIPIFVLDVCLFENMDMSLRIFEARYRSLVKDCIEKGLPFGILHSAAAIDDEDDDHEVKETEDESASGVTEKLSRVGCLVRIVNLISMREDGESQIVVRGVERFRVEGSLESQSGNFGLATAPVTALQVTPAKGAHENAEQGPTIPEVRRAAEEVLQQRILRVLPQEWKSYIQQLASMNKRSSEATQLDENDEWDLGKMVPEEFAFILAQWLASTGLVGSRVILSWMAQKTALDLLGKLNSFLTSLGAGSNQLEK